MDASEPPNQAREVSGSYYPCVWLSIVLPLKLNKRLLRSDGPLVDSKIIVGDSLPIPQNTQ